MTNKEIYNIVKEGDPIRIGGVLPDHYLAKEEDFILVEGKTKYGMAFDVINNTLELDRWYMHNYHLSGKYSDDLTMILLPGGPNIRIEIKDNKIFKVLWAVGGMFVDITHNINFLGGVPIGRMPSNTGYLHGTIISNLKEDELYKLLISPFPDERVLDCEFVVSYAYFFPIMFDTIKDMFESLVNIGFKTAAFITTTIPKWSRGIENAKLMSGGGALGYGCTRVLTAYSDMKVIEMLSGRATNWWGVITEIPPTSLFEIIGISWTTIVCDNKVNIVPVISFKYNILGEIKNEDIVVDDKHKIFYKTIGGFEIEDISKYYVGDVFDGVVVNGVLTLNRRFGSKNVPIVISGCPKCGYGVDVSSGKIYCINPKCPAVVAHNIKVWVDRFCSETDMHLIEDFLFRYEIKNIGDIYTVVDSGDKFDLKHSSIYYGVSSSREAPGSFLYILMPFLTLEECDHIMMNFSLSSMNAEYTIKYTFSPSTLARLGFNEAKIDKILEFLDTHGVQFINILAKYQSPPKNPSYHRLYKRTFFIGGLLYERDITKYELIINKYCGRVVLNFSPFISGVIYGKYIDSAMLEAVRQLATHKDVAIYSEEEFNKLVEQADGGM